MYVQRSGPTSRRRRVRCVNPGRSPMGALSRHGLAASARGATPIVSQRFAQHPRYRTSRTLTRHFHTIAAHRRGEQALAAWCRLAEPSGSRRSRPLRRPYATIGMPSSRCDGEMEPRPRRRVQPPGHAPQYMAGRLAAPLGNSRPVRSHRAVRPGQSGWPAHRDGGTSDRRDPFQDGPKVAWVFCSKSAQAPNLFA